MSFAEKLFGGVIVISSAHASNKLFLGTECVFLLMINKDTQQKNETLPKCKNP